MNQIKSFSELQASDEGVNERFSSFSFFPPFVSVSSIEGNFRQRLKLPSMEETGTHAACIHNKVNPVE